MHETSRQVYLSILERRTLWRELEEMRRDLMDAWMRMNGGASQQWKHECQWIRDHWQQERGSSQEDSETEEKQKRNASSRRWVCESPHCQDEDSKTELGKQRKQSEEESSPQRQQETELGKQRKQSEEECSPQRQQELEGHYPKCLLCETYGHIARDCRRWLDEQPEPQPPGIKPEDPKTER